MRLSAALPMKVVWMTILMGLIDTYTRMIG